MLKKRVKAGVPLEGEVAPSEDGVDSASAPQSPSKEPGAEAAVTEGMHSYLVQ